MIKPLCEYIENHQTVHYTRMSTMVCELYFIFFYKPVYMSN